MVLIHIRLTNSDCTFLLLSKDIQVHLFHKELHVEDMQGNVRFPLGQLELRSNYIYPRTHFLHPSVRRKHSCPAAVSRNASRHTSQETYRRPSAHLRFDFLILFTDFRVQTFPICFLSVYMLLSVYMDMSLHKTSGNVSLSRLS